MTKTQCLTLAAVQIMAAQHIRVNNQLPTVVSAVRLAAEFYKEAENLAAEDAD